MINKVKISGYRIFREFELEPHKKLNLLVGANESGKSTLLEAMILALTGRINGRRVPDELNPFWFNTDMVNEFVANRKAGKQVAPPEICIELFFEDRDELQYLCGAINTDVPTTACPGVSLRIVPNPEYAEEFEAWLKDPSPLLPIEYYMDEWRDFADNRLTKRPRQLVTAVIDSRTIRSTSGVDYHLRQILADHLKPSERTAISLGYREAKVALSDSGLKSINERIGASKTPLHDKPISLAMDQSARTSWETAITPHVDGIPFAMSGQGQQAAIKISLAMDRHSERATFVMIEEPENHLSHTSLATLVSRMSDLAGEQQQLFVTTHSSFVLNRLGIDSLMLVSPTTAARIPELKPDTVRYFQKLPGYDTLRLALAERIVLVEGPSDEIVFERIFKDLYGKRPMDLGIDTLSMRGLSISRALELCSVLGKRVAAVRDNDGFDPDELRKSETDWLSKDNIDLFIGDVAYGTTLEPQLVYFNGEELIRSILGISPKANLSKWMQREKTEVALRIAESEKAIKAPDYLRQAAEFIHG